MNERDIFVLLSTCPDAATAECIARELVGASLVACVNTVPGLRSIHDVPEIVALPVADGHHSYLQWVAESTRIP